MHLNIPNIRSMVLGTRLGFNSFLIRFGISKVVRDGKPEFSRNRNGQLERYLSYQQIRLENLSDDPIRFWKVADLLLKRSKAFRMLALRNVRPHWYKDVTWKQTTKWLVEVDQISRDWKNTFEIQRTPIPKPDGGIRYINNPGVPMRMHLWILNMTLHYWLKDRLYEDQHGHRAGKGAVTCWKSILDKKDNFKYIFEFDYKKFHDQIDRKVLMMSLERMGIPLENRIRLVELCSAYVKKFDKEDPMDQNFIVEGRYKHFYRGVVQGSNIAGLLGLCVLEALNLYELEGKYVGYADDGLLFMNDPQALEQWMLKLNPLYGLALKESKSGWVKYDNVWLKELKFIGLAYDGLLDILRANTHSGKEKIMVWEEKLEDFMSGVKIPYSSDRIKSLNYRNGHRYLSLLMSEVWKQEELDLEGSAVKVLEESEESMLEGSAVMVPENNVEGSDPEELMNSEGKVEMEGSADKVPEIEDLNKEQNLETNGSAQSGVPGCLREEVWKFTDKVNVSSYAFWLLSKRINALKCEKKAWKGYVERPEVTVVDQGGFLYVSDNRMVLNSIKLKDGRDLVPSNSRKASPRVVTNLKIRVNASVSSMWNHKW